MNTCVETSGFIATTRFKQILPFVDIFLFDYKVTGSEEHKKYTGVPNERILENLNLAYQNGNSILLRCIIVSGINDTEQHFKSICALNAKYPNLEGIEILPYHNIGNNKRTSIGIETTLPDLKSTAPELSEKWIDQLKKMGCENVKIG